MVAARQCGAAAIVDPSPFAVKSIAATYAQVPQRPGHPARHGLRAEQVADLQATIEATPCDVVVSATPIDLTRVLKVSKPMVRVAYELAEQKTGILAAQVKIAIATQVPVG